MRPKIDIKGLPMPVLSFPHSYLPEAVWEKMYPFFGQITICLPWNMEIPPSVQGGVDRKQIKILRPPNILRPPDNFQNILNEYRRWMDQNRGRHYAEMVVMDKDVAFNEDTLWEIRQMLKDMSDSSLNPNDNNALKWHLILHLAKEVEELCMEADLALKGLKQKGPLLEGSIEDTDDIKALLADLPWFGSEFELNEIQIQQIFSAWFGLFGEYLHKYKRITTFNSYIMDFLSGQWDDWVNDPAKKQPPIKVRIPDLSHHPRIDQEEIDKEYRLGERLNDIKSLLFRLEEDPAYNLAKLDTLSKELIKGFPWDLSSETFIMMVKYLYPIPDESLSQTKKVLLQFLYKTIILVEVDPVHV